MVRRKSTKQTETASTISILEACAQLGVSEQFIRLSVQAIYPDFETITEISLTEFEGIAKALQEQLQNTEEHTTEQQITEDLTTQQQLIEEQSTEQQTAQQQITSEQTALAASQPDALAQQQQQINSGVSNALSFLNDYSLALEKISSALAYIAAKKAVTNFVQIHSAVFQNDLENYLGQFAAEMSNVAENINQSNANDFLSQKGIVPKPKKTVEEILNSCSGLF